MPDPGAFTTAAPKIPFGKPDSGRQIAAAWPKDSARAFTPVPPVCPVARPRQAGKGGEVRVVLVGAALMLLCAVGLGGCGGRMAEEVEPLEQGEWLVYSDLQT